MKSSKYLKLAGIAILSILGLSIVSAPITLAVYEQVCDKCGQTEAETGIPDEVCAASGCPRSGTTGVNDFQGTLTGILNAIISIMGIVAVVFIVIGGINYVTSTGDSGKVKKAKDTILYALIGLVICALSYAIVNWVIMNAISPQP